jgi:hypothetical protein
MIPWQTFLCPRCGAPGQVNYGQAEYSCTCRFGTYQMPQEPQKWQQIDTWPKCATCGQPIYHGHICTTATTQGKRDE